MFGGIFIHPPSGENVSPSALVLDVGIRLPLDQLLNLESCRTESTHHLVRMEKEEVHANLVTPPLIQMNGLVADVEGQKEYPAWPQDPPQLAQRPRQVARWNVDNGVKGYNACPRIIRYVQGQHVALSKLNSRGQAARPLHHRRRQIHATNLNAALVQIPSDVSRPAPHVARRANILRARGKAVE
jgi:hypothetical protein